MDNQNNNNLVSSQYQNNQAVSAEIAALFAGDSYGLFVFQKVEGLVRAVYLLTNLMSDKEPMRERVRILANIMLENALGMSVRVWGEDLYHKNLISAICEISTLFDISVNAKMMSKMNHQIIASELQKLADFLATSLSNYSSAKIAFEPNLLSGNYNYVPDQSFQQAQATRNQNILAKDDITKTSGGVYEGHRDVINGSIKDSKNKGLSFTKMSTTEKVVKDKNNRQEIILSMLKSGVKLTIKDFAKNITGCSDKTIQRELLSLLSKGIIKKEGERRWSKYFLSK